jgi:hypothetical protein
VFFRSRPPGHALRLRSQGLLASRPSVLVMARSRILPHRKRCHWALREAPLRPSRGAGAAARCKGRDQCIFCMHILPVPFSLFFSFALFLFFSLHPDIVRTSPYRTCQAQIFLPRTKALAIADTSSAAGRGQHVPARTDPGGIVGYVHILIVLCQESPVRAGPPCLGRPGPCFILSLPVMTGMTPKGKGRS